MLRGGRPSQAGKAVAGAILHLGNAGYLTLSHQESQGIILSRTYRKVDFRDAWAHNLLATLFGEPNKPGATLLLGGPKNATKPIAAKLARRARNNARKEGLAHWLRPRLALVWARVFALVVWFVFLGIQGMQSDYVGVLGVAVAGILVWIVVFLACLEPMCKKRLWLTNKGEARLAEHGQLHPAPQLDRRPTWWHGAWSPDAVTTAMAAALGPRKRFRWLRALQVELPAPEVSRAS